LVDFTKAFDYVNRGHLLKKLSIAGYRGKILNILTSFFENRTQSTKLGNCISNCIKTDRGIPQGSILSPFLFNIYTNDLHFFLGIKTTPQYIDDTSILIEAWTTADLELNINYALCSLAEWAFQNELLINYVKTKYILFFEGKATNALKISINNQQITEVYHAKLLGIEMQNTLKWNTHAENVVSKISQCLGFFHRNAGLLPHKMRVLIYHSLFQSHLIFGVQIWGNLSQEWIHKIMVQQKRALNYLKIRNQTIHQICMINKTLLFSHLIQYYQLILVFKTLKGLSTDLVWTPTLRCDVHNHDTRPAAYLGFCRP